MKTVFPGRAIAALLVVGACLARGGSQAWSQGDVDLSGAPLPQAIRNALTRNEKTEITGAPAVLQEGPVDPALYRLGAGDELTVHYTGRTSVTHRLLLSPEGSVFLPDVGTVDLAGVTLDQGKKKIRAAAGRILRNVQVDVTLTALRTFKVAVGGEIRSPGVYAATAVTRLSELLTAAGGPGDSAALRNILVRGPGNDPVTHADLLPFLTTGRMVGSNPLVLDGQSVFVPRRSRLVTVAGAVLRPGVYDLPDSLETVGGLLDLVGLAEDAALDRVELIGTGGTPQSSLAIMAGTGPGGNASQPSMGLEKIRNTALEHGNQVLVPRLGGFARPDLVTIEGEVRYPGTYSIAGSDHDVDDLIEEAGGFTPDAVQSRVRLVRPLSRRYEDAELSRLENGSPVELTATEKERLRSQGVADFRAVTVDLSNRSERQSPEGARGPRVMSGDRILVPRAGSYVEVSGRVLKPGFYPFRPGQSAERYVDEAGGYADRADRRNIRIAAGPGDNFLLAKDAGPPEPGDRVWVPERTPRSRWDTTKDLLLVLGQLATIFIVIDQAGKN